MRGDCRERERERERGGEQKELRTHNFITQGFKAWFWAQDNLSMETPSH